MATDYPTDPLTVLRGALVNLADSALYVETEMGEHIPDPEYIAHLRAAIAELVAAKTLGELVAVEWVQGRAAAGLDGLGEL